MRLFSPGVLSRDEARPHDVVARDLTMFDNVRQVAAEMDVGSTQAELAHVPTATTSFSFPPLVHLAYVSGVSRSLMPTIHGSERAHDVNSLA